MAQQKFAKGTARAHAIPQGVAVHLETSDGQRPEYIGGLASEYRITVERDGPGRWLVRLELTLTSGPVTERTLHAPTLKEACQIAAALRSEMQSAFAIAQGFQR